MTAGGCEITLTETPEGDVLMQMKVEPHAKGGLATATVWSAPEGSKVVLGRYASVKLTPRDRAALRAALDEEDSDCVRLVDRQGDLLTATVKALRGDPPELVWWSHHDVAELATAAVQTIARTLARADHWQFDVLTEEAKAHFMEQARKAIVEELTDAQKDPTADPRAALAAEADSRKE